MNPTLVLCVGNPLRGDDGAGARVAEMLRARPLPEGVDVEEAAAPGLALAAWVEGRSRLVVVDAARMGEASGTWRRFTLESLRPIAAEGRVSLHEAGLADGLALAQALAALPDEFVFYGVEPASLDRGSVLSPAVQSALPGLVESLLAEVRRPPPK